jgi:uncharacterized protein YndB with AHSA1/START domain
MADIFHLAGIKAEPNEVFEALTHQDHIRSWWSQFTEASPEVGALNVVSFYGGMAEFKLRVQELVPDEKVVWAVEGGPPDWADTTITWSLSAGEGMTAGQTMVHLAHRGFAEMDASFANVNYNWGWYLTSLKFYLEKGEGMPHTEADMM